MKNNALSVCNVNTICDNMLRSVAYIHYSPMSVASNKVTLLNGIKRNILVNR